MRRSEMLQLIKKQWNDSTSFPTDEAVARYILDAIEKSGMLPPSITVTTTTYDPSTGSYSFKINEWEPENG